jgi:hypothetical protein
MSFCKTLLKLEGSLLEISFGKIGTDSNWRVEHRWTSVQEAVQKLIDFVAAKLALGFAKTYEVRDGVKLIELERDPIKRVLSAGCTWPSQLRGEKPAASDGADAQDDAAADPSRVRSFRAREFEFSALEEQWRALTENDDGLTPDHETLSLDKLLSPEQLEPLTEADVVDFVLNRGEGVYTVHIDAQTGRKLGLKSHGPMDLVVARRHRCIPSVYFTDTTMAAGFQFIDCNDDDVTYTDAVLQTYCDTLPKEVAEEESEEKLAAAAADDK